MPEATFKRPGGIVLCGGESRRMGRDKASLPFGPETLLQRVVRQLASQVFPIVVVAAELVRGLHLVSKGEIYVTRSAGAILQAYKEGIQNTQALGVQERRVLRLIAEGKRTEEIAGILDISYQTVRSHRKHIMEKLDVRDTAALVRYSIVYRLLEA